MATTTPPRVTAFGVARVCVSHLTAGRHSQRLNEVWIPSNTFPERATRKRSAAAAVASEVTATPSGNLAAWGCEAIPETSAVLETQLGADQFRGDSSKSERLARARAYVTQFHGSQMNRSGSRSCRFVQCERAAGSKLRTCTTLILLFLRSTGEQRKGANCSTGMLCGQIRRISSAPARSAVAKVLSSRPTPQTFRVSVAADMASGTTTTTCMAVPLR